MRETVDQQTHDIRNLMALAAALRHLALDSGPRESTLYLSAAAMLHRRAADLAGLRPPKPDSQKQSQRATPRKRIDIRI